MGSIESERGIKYEINDKRKIAAKHLVAEIEDSITEEMTDVVLCLDLLNGYYTDYKIYVGKLKRWVERLVNKNADD